MIEEERIKAPSAQSPEQLTRELARYRASYLPLYAPFMQARGNRVYHTPTQIEWSSSDGRYYLEKLFTPQHLDDAGKVFVNCLVHKGGNEKPESGNSRFSHTMRNNGTEVFVLREMTKRQPHPRLVVFEYSPVSKHLVQKKAMKNSAPSLAAPYYEALLDAFDFIKEGTAYDYEGKPYVRGLEYELIDTTPSSSAHVSVPYVRPRY